MIDYDRRKQNKRPVVPTKIGGLIICVLFAGSLIFGGLMSAIEPDQTISKSENRKLTEFPKASVESVFNGSFERNFDDYFADHFYMRDKFIEFNKFFSDLFTKNKSGNNDMVIVDKGGKDDFAGQSIE